MRKLLSNRCILATCLSSLLLLLASTPSAFAGLLHRWSFSETGGSGTILADSVGGADALIVEVGANDADVGTTYAGQVHLTGGAQGASDYVELPDGTINAITGDCTIELWATHRSVQNWARIFDFGSTTGDWLAMTWSAGTNPNGDEVRWYDTGVAGDNNNAVGNTMQPYSYDVEYHIAMTIDVEATGPGTKTVVRWYKDGVYINWLDTDCRLTDLGDTISTLGRSKYGGDATANASYNELRIYDEALTAAQIAFNTTLGPNVPLPHNTGAARVYSTQATLTGELMATNGPTYVTAYWGQTDGGTNKADVANALRYEYHDDVGGADLTLDDGVANGANGGLFVRVPSVASNWYGEVWQGDSVSDYYCKMWWGTFTPPLTGTYEFFVHGDDNEVLWIDTNLNGEFEEAEGELVSDSRPPEGWNTPHTETVDLTAGNKYLIAMAFVEGGGGDFFNITIKQPGGVAQRIDPGNAAQSGWWSIPGWLHAVPLGQSAIGAVAATVSGLDAEQWYTYTYHASNATWQMWAPSVGTFETPAAGVWVGAVDRLWGSVSNWSDLNVPDTAGEDALLPGTSPGNVLLGGSSVTAGALTFSGGDYTVADTNAAPGTFTLAALTNSGGANAIGVEMTVNGTADVSGGTLTLASPSDFTAALIDLHDATLAIQGNDISPNALHEWYFDGGFNDSQIDPIDSGSGFMTMIPGAKTLLDTALNFGGAEMNTRSGGLVGTDTIGALWWGRVVIGDVGSGAPLEAGRVSFGTRSDDGSVVWVDTDGDGVFSHAGARGDEMIVNNKGGHGEQNRVGSVSLAAGEYAIAIGFYEGGGGEAMRARYAAGIEGNYDNMAFIDPSQPGQAGLWKAPLYATAQENNAPITVTADATLQTPGDVDLGAVLTVTSGITLSKTGSGTLLLNGVPDLEAGSVLSIAEGSLNLPPAIAAILGPGSVELSGGSLTINGDTYYISGQLRHYGYDYNNDNDLNLDGNAGLMAVTPGGKALLTTGPGDRGLDFNDDNDFINTGAIQVPDNYMNLFLGYFNAQETGNHEFRIAQDDDRSGIWLDLDQDGVFESSVAGLGSNRGEQLAWEDTGTKTVTLTAGERYLFAVTHREGGGGSGIEARFKTPSMGAEAVIKPGDAGQSVFWSALAYAGVSMTNAPLIVSENSLFRVRTDSTADLGRLAVADGATLSVQGQGDGLVTFSQADMTGGLSLASADVTLNNFSSAGGTYSIASDSSLTVDGPLTADSILAIGRLSAPGTITATTKVNFEPTQTVSNVLAGTAEVWIGDNDGVNGQVIFTATNLYTGRTVIERGTFRADEGVGLPLDSRLVFNQNNRDQVAVLETSGTFARNIGAGTGEVRWDNIGGFAARGGDLTVTLEGNAALAWSNADTGFNNRDSIQFGSSTADGRVELTNPIDFEWGWRRFQVCNNVNTYSDVTRLSGVISGAGEWWDWLRINESWGNEFYDSLLEFTATNSYVQGTLLDQVVLYAVDGVGLPSASRLEFNGDQWWWTESCLLSQGTFTRNIGDQPGEVAWQHNSGGFAARGGDLVVTLEGGAVMNWWDWGQGFNGKVLQLNSQYADSRVELTNPIDIANDERTLALFNNPATDQDVAVLSGTVSGTNHGTYFRIYGPDKTGGGGVLWLKGANAYDQVTLIRGSALRFDSQAVNLSPNTTFTFWEQNEWYPHILEGKGTLDLNVGPYNEVGAVSWEWNHGGFAAYGGPLTVTLEGGVTLDVGDMNVGLNQNAWRWLQLGSRTADNVVELVNDLTVFQRDFMVMTFDNPYSEDDRAVLSGEIAYGGTWGNMVVRGDGTLAMTATNHVGQLRIYDTAVALFNGHHLSQDCVFTEYGQNGTIGGTGTLHAVNYIDVRSGGFLAPGDGAVGILTMKTDGIDVELQNSATYEWELSGYGSDKVTVEGNLRLSAGWQVKIVDGGAGMPSASDEYVLFTYTGSMNDYTAPTLDTSAVPAHWVAAGVTVVHDPVGKRVYLTGLYSTLSIGNRAADNLTSVSADLNGVVSCSGQVLNVWAYWGGTDEGTTWSAWDHEEFVGAFNDVIDINFSHSIFGLDTNALYYFRFRATNATENMWAQPSLSFNALGPPVVENNGSEDVVAGSATLRGHFLDHNRGAVTVCWGLADGGTSSIGAWDHSMSIGTPTAAAFSELVSPVYYPQTYYYRFYAVNAYGTDWSSLASTFTVSTKPESSYALSGLMGRWTFDDDSCDDSSGNDYHGDKVGGVYSTDVPGVLGGKSIDLRGGDYFVKVDTGGSQDVFDLDALSVACWVKGWPDGGWEPWISKRGEGGQGWQFRRFSGSADQISWTLRGPGNDDWWVTSNINDGGWHHLVATYGDTKRRIYVDNVLVGEETRYGLINDTADMLVFGARQDNGSFGYYSRLQLDDILIYNRAITAAEVQQLAGNEVVSAVTVANAQPTEVTTDSARLNADLSLPNCVYDVWVFYGLVDQGADAALWTSAVKVGTYSDYAGTVGYDIGGLVQGNTYWYTFRLSNAVDSIWATPSMDVKPVTVPTVINAPGALVHVGEAALRGQLTDGQFADIYVYWGRTDGGTDSNAWDAGVYVGELREGAFSTNIVAGYGHTYYYRCYGVNAAGSVWAASSTNFMLSVPPLVGDTYETGLRGSIFTGVPGDETPVNLDGGSFSNSLSRVFVGDKAGSILALTEESAFNVIVDGEVNGWNQFPGFVPVDYFVTALSGRIFPRTTGTHVFRWSNDDRGLMYIDRNRDGIFDNAERVAGYAWNGTGFEALTNGIGYDFIFMAQEQGGGESLNWWVTEPNGGEERIHTVNQAALWRYPAGIDDLLRFSNLAVTGITTNDATINASFFADGWMFDVYACWGTNDGQQVTGDWEHVVHMGAYTNYDGGFSLSLTNLLEGSNYWFSFYAANEVTNMWGGPTLAFTTKSFPVVTNLPPSSVIARSGTLRGHLTMGGFADVTVYWGFADGGTDPNAWQNADALGTVVVGTFGTNVSLWAGGEYYYRCYATNDLGSDWADTTERFSAAELRDYWRAGLLAGSTAGNMYFGVNPATNVYLGPHMATTNLKPPWTDDTTWIYTGQLYMNGGTYHFCENIDDKTRLIVDGTQYINDGSWGTPAPSGPITRPAGWYDIDIRFSNGGGGAGPVANNGWTATKGFGYNVDGVDSNQGGDYIYPEDPGDMSLFRCYDTRANGFPVHPTLANEPYSALTTDSVMMNGSLSATGWAFRVYGMWGTNDGAEVFADWEHADDLGMYTNYVGALGNPLSGLLSGSNYWYTFYASNGVTNVWGGTGVPLQTRGVPLIVNHAASGMTTRAATLNGELVRGGFADVTLYWGLVDKGQNHAGWDHTNSFGNVEYGALSTNVSVLSAGTYFYRFYATNAQGEDWSDASEVFYTATGTVSIADASVVEGHPGDTPVMQFTVSLSDLAAQDVTVLYSTVDGAAAAGLDFTAKTDTMLTIPAGVPTGLATVTVLGDRLYEYGSEAFTVALSAPVNATLADATATGTVLDDDADSELEGWDYKMKIYFSGYTGSETLTNFPAMVKLNESIPGFRYADVTSLEGWDLRFVRSDLSDYCSYEIERWDPAGDSTVWVRLPELSGTNTYVWAYWGNPHLKTGVINSPLQIGGCSLWLKADSLALGNNEPVAVWADSSGHRQDATQSTPADRPRLVWNAINGKPAVRYDGTSKFLVGPDTPVQARTIFIVCKVDADAPGLSGVFNQKTDADTQNIRLNSTTTWRAPGQGADGNDFCNSGGAGEVRVNGAAGNTHNNQHHVLIVQAGVQQTFGYQVGQRAYSRYFKGDVAELIIFDDVLTADEQNRVGYYLDHKYGLGTAFTPFAPTTVSPPALALDGSTWSEGYEAVWHFGGNAEDSTLRYTAAAQGDPTYVLTPAVAGMAIDLDGAVDWVDVSDGFGNFDGGITVEAWARTESYANWARIIDFGNGAGVDNVLLARIGTGDDLRWEFHDTAGGGEGISLIDMFALNTWQYFATTCSPGAPNAATMRVYRDALEEAVITDGSVPRNINRVNNYIGKSNWADALFDGQMDELRLSTVERSADWIGAVHMNMANHASFNAYGTVLVRPPTLFIFK